MNKLISKWIDGIGYLIFDDLISFYTFFTVAFAECAYLWNYKSSSIASTFTIILLCYVLNVIVCAYIKGRCEGTRKEIIIARVYAVVFVILFIIGCFIDSDVSITMYVNLFCTTAIWIGIRMYQNTDFTLDFDERVQIISKFFNNKVVWFNSQLVVILGPFIVLAVFFSMIPGIPTILKVIILVLYLICMPLIAVFEDETAGCNIFEIAFRITWKENDDC